MAKFQTTQSDLVKYNGMDCEILGKVDASTYDKEDVGDMYNIRLKNGAELQAFPDEIIES